MNISRPTAKHLAKFRMLAEKVIITPSGRFYAFGAGKKGIHKGVVVEGRINEKVRALKVVHPPSPIDSTLIEMKKAGSYENLKLLAFDDLISDAHEVASFFLDIDTLKILAKTSQGTSRTHIRFFRKTDQKAFARSFDARKYFTGMIADSEETDSYENFQLDNFVGENFYTYVRLATFRLIDNDDYQVSVLSNGIMIFSGMNNDLTYYCRDQALGEKFELEIDHPILKNVVPLFDPRRRKEIRRKIEAHR